MSLEIQRQGILFVISAPSGGGKSTIVSTIRERDPEMGYSVSATTRKPRTGEVDGQHYFFHSVDEFRKLIRKKAFYEWAVVHNNLYGTPRETIDGELNACRDIVLDIDVQGGLHLRRLKPDAVLIFLLPPSMKILEKRLRNRKSDSDEAIEVRLGNARDELSYAPKYDYALINHDLETAVGQVRAIIAAERARADRLTFLANGQDLRLPQSDLFSPMPLGETL